MKKILIGFIAVLSLFSCKSTTESEDSGYKVLIGAYTQSSPDGIYYYSFDKDMSNPVKISALSLKNASFLAENDGIIYTVNEESEGMLQAYKFDATTGSFEFINERETGGAHPCYVAVGDRMLYVANYSGGSLAAFPVENDGSIGERSVFIANVGSGPKTDRQEKSHIHSANLSSDGKTLWVADLGTDEVLIYDVDGQNLKEKTRIKLNPGVGPRHIAFHPSLPLAYVICELESEVATVSTTDYNITDITTTLAQEDGAPNFPADIHISPDSKFLYGSNRGVNDLAFYSIDAENGSLVLLGNESVKGDFPRNFAISPDGKYLLAANQRSDNVVVFKRDTVSGSLTPTGIELEISIPVFVKFL